MGPWDYPERGSWSQNRQNRNRPTNSRRSNNNFGYTNQGRVNQGSSNQRNMNRNNFSQNNMNHESNNRPNQNPQSSMQQGGYDINQLEMIKKAVKENRIEFLNGGARIIDAPPINKEPVSKNQDTVREPTNTNKDDDNTLVEEIDNLDEQNIYNQQLKDFIQRERNANIFYKYLSSIADNEENSSALEYLSNESKRHFNELNILHEEENGTKYEVKETKINNIINFKDGIAWAIELENKGLIDIIDISENIESETTYKKINSIIGRKTCYISILHLMLYNSKEDNSIEQT